MKGGKRPQGYTVVELMIVLAVSSALFISVAAAMSGQQAKAEYTQALRDIETKLGDVANDVRTGYFPNRGNGEIHQCVLSGDAPSFTPTIVRQGESPECIFVGKAVQFEPQGESGSIKIHTLVGRRAATSGADVGNFAEANVRVARPLGDYLTETYRLKYGMRVHGIKAATPNGGGSIDIVPTNGNPNSPGPAVVAFMTSFSGTNRNDITGDISIVNTTSPLTDVFAIQSSALNSAASTIDPLLQTSGTDGSYRRPDQNGIRICLVKDGQYSRLTIGGANQRQNIEAVRLSGASEC